MEHEVRILKAEPVTHDVKRFVVEKPDGYGFTPGQATDVSISREGWRDKKRPFTFTSLSEEETLEFIIKAYPGRNGVTDHIHKLSPGDMLVIGDPWGTIEYRGSGVFIAGGAGVTPFIAILRMLRKKGRLEKNMLLLSNRTASDVIIEKELRSMLGNRFISTLTREKIPGHEYGRIDRDFLKKHVRDFSQNFYVCGPPEFVDSIKSALKDFGAKPDSLVFEE